MKLQHACAAYGLLPITEDFDAMMPGGVGSRVEHITRVQRLTAQLNAKIFGAQLLVVTPTSSGTLTIEYGEHQATYGWYQTAEYAQAYKWSCGLMEAMFRRFISNKYEHLPKGPHIHAQMEDWPT